MRTIDDFKFRVWLAFKKKMYQWDLSSPDKWISPIILGDYNVSLEGINIMQWTGQQDRNDIDIFEGDVVEWVYDMWELVSKAVGVVEYIVGDYEACFKIRQIKACEVDPHSHISTADREKHRLGNREEGFYTEVDFATYEPQFEWQDLAVMGHIYQDEYKHLQEATDA